MNDVAFIVSASEADVLGNDELFVWYDANVLRAACLLPLIELKSRSHSARFTESNRCRSLTIVFLQSLHHAPAAAGPY